MVTPTDYVGNLMELANNRRGEFVEMKYLTGVYGCGCGCGWGEGACNSVCCSADAHSVLFLAPPPSRPRPPAHGAQHPPLFPTADTHTLCVSRSSPPLPPNTHPHPHTDSRTTLVFNIPLAEVVTDYFDQLKSRSKGYASMEYKITGYRWGFGVLSYSLPKGVRCVRGRVGHEHQQLVWLKSLCEGCRV